MTNNTTTKDLVQIAVFSALICIFTMVNIRLPFSLTGGGLVHLGNIPFFLICIVFGAKKGALSGAFGMAIFDIIGGFAMWAPFTFAIRLIMGYIVGTISQKRNGDNIGLNILACILGGIFMIFGYYCAEVALYGNNATPLLSIPGDIMQLLIGMLVAIPSSKRIKKICKQNGLL